MHDLLNEQINKLREETRLLLLEVGFRASPEDSETVLNAISERDSRVRRCIDRIQKLTQEIETSSLPKEDEMSIYVADIARKIPRDVAHSYRKETEWRTNASRRAIQTKRLFEQKLRNYFPEAIYDGTNFFTGKAIEQPSVNALQSIPSIVSLEPQYTSFGQLINLETQWTCGIETICRFDPSSGRLVRIQVLTSDRDANSDMGFCASVQTKATQVYYAAVAEEGPVGAFEKLFSWLAEALGSIFTCSVRNLGDRKVFALTEVPSSSGTS